MLDIIVNCEYCNRLKRLFLEEKSISQDYFSVGCVSCKRRLLLEVPMVYFGLCHSSDIDPSTHPCLYISVEKIV